MRTAETAPDLNDDAERLAYRLRAVESRLRDSEAETIWLRKLAGRLKAKQDVAEVSRECEAVFAAVREHAAAPLRYGATNVGPDGIERVVGTSDVPEPAPDLPPKPDPSSRRFKVGELVSHLTCAGTRFVVVDLVEATGRPACWVRRLTADGDSVSVTEARFLEAELVRWPSEG